MSAYCSKSDLELAVGGAAVLVRLLDKDRNGVADANLIDACLTKATSEADCALQIRHQLPLQELPAILTTHVAALAAYYAHQMGTDGQGVPDRHVQAAADARTFFDQLAEGHRTIGIPHKPATDQDVRQINTDPYGDRVTRRSLKGFW